MTTQGIKKNIEIHRLWFWQIKQVRNLEVEADRDAMEGVLLMTHTACFPLEPRNTIFPSQELKHSRWAYPSITN